MASDSQQANAAVQLYEARSGEYDGTWHVDFTERFAAQLNIKPGQRVLDLACGTGLLTFREADAVGSKGKVVGVDVTPGMLAQAKAKKQRDGPNYDHVEFFQGDILNLRAIDGLKENSFDVISVASALVLFPDPAAAIKHWTQYLKEGGIIAVDSTHPRNLVSGIVIERIGRKLGISVPYHRDWSQSEDSLKRVLEAAGLQVEKVTTIDNQAGYGRRYYDFDDADDQFVSHVIVGISRDKFRDPEIRKKAHTLFLEEWNNLAVNGKVEEVDAVFLGVARKTKLTSPTASAQSNGAKAQAPTNTEVIFTGGCRCGNIKYSSTSPPSQITHCHCRACQQVSGSSYLPFFEIPTTALTYHSSSTLQTLKLSDAAIRTFCSSCGTPISMVYLHGGWDKRTSLTVGSVDVGTFKGEFPGTKQHIFLREKAPWTVLPEDGAPRYETASEAQAGYIEKYSKTV
ncbi:S-adenosyl-L-methionine-dependent methyltransferase [Lophiotrema nucula]|uniref:S-adenosyl-L-methionine-dependent methyltransferase n=1 Tax=Lophiotrema nucula TaxID=690887 RepID=A0A6A5YF84_9PLEO|nr:S-adenosyl-L-methionine-dependent methyltransferase [Lophiotrema nucula]